MKGDTLNYKDLFRQIIAILSAPGKAWDEIVGREKERNVVSSFVYPMIALCSLAKFIGVFIGRDIVPDVFQMALTRCCAVAVALFGGFFLAVYLLDKMSQFWLKKKESITKIQVFVGYSMTVTFVLDVVSGLFSLEILHWILQIYTIVIVFEGARRLMNIPESRLTLYTLAVTIIILLCPALIELIFNELSVILN